MLAFEMIWEELPFFVIKNCWKHLGLCSATLIDTVALFTFDEEYQAAMQSCTHHIAPTHAHIEISQRLIPERGK